MLRQRDAERLGIGRQEARSDPQELLGHGCSGRDNVRDAVGQTQRINLLAAKEHGVGKPGAAEKHADDRLLVDPAGAVAAPQRDELASNRIRREIGPGELDQPLERFDRIAARAEIESDEVGLAAGSTATGGGSSPKWPPL